MNTHFRGALMAAAARKALLAYTVLLPLCACQPKAPAPPPQPAALVASVTDIGQRLARYAPVRLQTDTSGLSDRDRQMLAELVAAAQVMDGLFWQQAYGERAALVDALADPDTRTLVELNYGPWDRLDGDRPFITGVGAKPEGSNLYPADITREQLATLSDVDRKALYSVVHRDPQGKLFTVPYREAFKQPLAEAAGHLRKAADLSDDESFAGYLRERAKAFETDDYRPSDLAWMDMKTNRFDLVIGPIESYEDKLEGTRTAFEAYVLRKDLQWSERLARFTALLPALQRGLPVPAAYKKEQPGGDSQLNAYDVLLYAGEANSGAKTIALNLPNDEQVRDQKGTRRLQLKNAMQAKFDKILEPIAAELIDSGQLSQVNFDAFFDNLMFHEVAHGLGLARTIDGRKTVREAHKEYYGALEEAKADILGLYLVGQLLQLKEISGTTLEQHYVTFVAGILRSVRFGASDAHGKANMIEFNWFEDHGAFTRDAATGRYHVDVEKTRTASESLAARILKVQGDGNYETARAMVGKEGVVRPGLQADLDRLGAKSVPVDVYFEQGLATLGLQPAAAAKADETRGRER
jgi:Peptidase family M49